MNVLLVDDETVALSALARRVDWKGIGLDNVFTAGSMKEAQDVFREQTIDIFLIDIEMPQNSGLDLFEWVKMYYPYVECIFVTCHAEYEYIRKALLLGSADYILKPIDYDELKTVLQTLIERIKAGPNRVKLAADLAYPPEEKRSDIHDQVVDKVHQYIQEHIQEDIYITDIAGYVYLNDRHLMRVYRQKTGESILEYITKERLRLSREILSNTDHPISIVSDMVGYRNYSYFIRIFKREVGVTPQAYRQAYRGR